MHPDIDVLLRYLDHELLPAEFPKLEKHLDRCAECRLEVDRLRAATAPEPCAAVSAPVTLAEIRDWSSSRPSAHEAAVISRMAAELDPYLGPSGSAAVLDRVSVPGTGNMLPGVERVLADFLGRRAVANLIDRIVEHAIMRP